MNSNLSAEPSPRAVSKSPMNNRSDQTRQLLENLSQKKTRNTAPRNIRYKNSISKENTIFDRTNTNLTPRSSTPKSTQKFAEFNNESKISCLPG